ncbi:MAG: polymer-forming cytoskeletal protein [Anaerocolumna sp.]
MGFFKEFKDDLSQAVNELLPEEVFDDKAEVNTLGDGAGETDTETAAADDLTDTEDDDNVDMDILDAILTKEENVEEESQEEKAEIGEEPADDPKTEEKSSEPPSYDSDEVTVITKGTVINGNITSEGSLEVMGTIKGDIDCQGKLSIVGLVNGNCMAAEVYVGAKRFEGCISSEGSVKIGLGTVVIGDVTGTSGVIAGAVKGDIDISGSIIIDSSAVIKGNIKAQSIQINNGAVIEGFCSLSYASIDIDNIFE